MKPYGLKRRDMELCNSSHPCIYHKARAYVPFRTASALRGRGRARLEAKQIIAAGRGDESRAAIDRELDAHAFERGMELLAGDADNYLLADDDR